MELFCQSRRMMSIDNIPYRLEQTITHGGTEETIASGPIGCMERCRDNSDCKVWCISKYSNPVIDNSKSAIFRDSFSTLDIRSKRVPFTRILTINFFHLRQVVRVDVSVNVQMNTSNQLPLLDGSAKTSTATNHSEHFHQLISVFSRN